MNEQTYVCGWDGGGTKTEVLCLSPAGETLADAAFGPLNINGAAPEKVRATIQDCVDFMAAQPGGLAACAALVIGTAGVSNHHAVELIENSVREAGYTGSLRVLGDQEIALAGAVEGPGAVLVAGTGSICCGRNGAGQRTRSGGYGYLIDDEGSGYALGRDILKAVVRAADGRGAATSLTALVYEKLQVTEVSAVITWLYASTTGKKEIASLAPLLLTALTQEDPAALAIADHAAEELAALACAVWRKLGLQGGELALLGSILTRYERIRAGVTRLCRAAYPDMKVIAPRASAAMGAALLARDLKEER